MLCNGNIVIYAAQSILVVELLKLRDVIMS